MKEVLYSFLFGVGIGCYVAAILEWFNERRNQRRRIGPDQRSYFDPCGPECTMHRK